MKHLHALIVPTVAALFAAAVFAQDAPKPADLPDAPQATAAALVQPNGPTVVMDTSMGRITCQFFQKQAPNAVANFIGLAEGTKDWTDPVTSKKQHHKPLYDGTIFHRVIPEFMIQGGDPAGTGLGDPGFAFDDEFDPNLNFDVPGRLAMANSGPNTNGSQFFITEQAYDSLNQHYTIFGQCDEPSASRSSRPSRASSATATTSLWFPVTLKKVTIVPEGQPLPPPTRPPRRRRPSTRPTDSSNRPISSNQELLWHSHQAPTPSSTPRKARSPSAFLNRMRPSPSRTSSTSPRASASGPTPARAPNPPTSSIDGTIFHRVIPDFMIQGGDPAGTGMGGPGYRFEDETKGSKHKFDKTGKLAMANSGPNTNGCQFFITVAATPWLTGNHTIFGEVVEGQDIADKISKVARGGQDKPVKPVVLESVVIERVA